MKVKCITKLIITLSFCLLASTYAFNQNTDLSHNSHNKNSISVSAGLGTTYHFSMHNFVSFQYDRIFAQDSFKSITPILKIDFGKASNLAENHGHGTRYYSKVQFGLLIGKRNCKLELVAGLVYYYQMKWYPGYGFHPAGSVGWRYQKPGKSCFFRIATGLPEYFCIGAGFSF